MAMKIYQELQKAPVDIDIDLEKRINHNISSLHMERIKDRNNRYGKYTGKYFEILLKETAAASHFETIANNEDGDMLENLIIENDELVSELGMHGYVPSYSQYKHDMPCIGFSNRFKYIVENYFTRLEKERLGNKFISLFMYDKNDDFFPEAEWRIVLSMDDSEREFQSFYGTVLENMSDEEFSRFLINIMPSINANRLVNPDGFFVTDNRLRQTLNHTLSFFEPGQKTLQDFAVCV